MQTFNKEILGVPLGSLFGSGPWHDTRGTPRIKFGVGIFGYFN